MSKKKSLLWRITPPQGGPASYLFGTMHVRDLRAFGWLEIAREYLAASEVFAAEFDFSEADPVALAQALVLPEGKSLRDFLPRGAWKLLDRHAKKHLGSSADALQYQHPMSLSTLFNTAVMAEEASHSLDETLWNQALELGKKTTGVERFSEQIETLHRIPFEVHVKGLVWLLKNYRRQKKRIKKMMNYYVAGDIQALYQAAKKDAKGMRKELIYRRNRIMADRFIALARKQTLFCAVGAGHLAGAKGMLRLLKSAGWEIEPVFTPNRPASKS